MNAEESNIVRIREIAQGLESLRWKRDTLDEYKEFEESSQALCSAICDENWDLVGAAVELLRVEGKKNPRSQIFRRKHDARWIAQCLFRHEANFNKSEILDYIAQVHPEIFEAIPTTPSGLSEFWKSVGDVEQSRGYPVKERVTIISEIIESAKRMEKAGFPNFLGPRMNPNWE